MGLLDQFLTQHVDPAKRRLRGLLTDPAATLEQTAYNAVEQRLPGFADVAEAQSVMPQVAGPALQKFGELGLNTALVGMASHAKKGGEVANANGFFYKGGQFLPSTDAPPGTWRVGGKLIKSRRMEVEPGKWEQQPAPNAKAMYQLVSPGYLSKRGDDGRLVVNEGVTLNEGQIKVAGDMVATKAGHTLQELIDLYNKGMRWIELP